MSAPGPVVCVVGPTASGKSALAEEVAARLESSVVSVDAMQVYRGMDVGTAKTPPAERRVPLLMVDVVDPTEDYSVRLFQRDARSVVDGLLSAGRVPVLCGGTGLYLNAVIDDMEFPAGEKGCASRERYERLAAERGAPALHALLAECDPESAALIHPNNVRRVVRALEMLDEGVSYARHHEGLHERAARYDARLWGLTMSRERLYRRIDERVDAMVDQGLLEEVRELASRGLTAELSAGQAIGYKELKRQLSWFRHDGRVRWIDLDETSLDQAATRIVEDAGREAHGTI